MSLFKVIGLAALVCLPSTGRAQSVMDSVFLLPDSAKAFTVDNLYAVLLDHHPMVKQAQLLSETARQELRLARGSFDPKLESGFSSKEYQDKNYYTKWATSLSIPVWFPVDPKIGFESNEGAYVNPESTIPSTDEYRQWVTSIRLPIGRGLFTDDRRAAIKQAQLYAGMAEAEQIKLINKILLDAAKDYWQWYYAYYNFRLMNSSMQIAAEVLRRVRLNATFGEASSLDTIQARITWLQRQVERQEAYLEFVNQSIRISNYLWDAQGMPVQLSPVVTPVLDYASQEVPGMQLLNELLILARENHPELKKISIKLNQLEVDRKLAAEYLKPRLDLNYGFINRPFGPSTNLSTFQPGKDYKFGADFSFPLFLRKERAKLAQTKLKIRGAELERTQAERDILNSIQQVFNQLTNTRTIIEQQSGMAENYQQLLSAELVNLELGESDLFKINVQQEKVIQSQSKLLKLRSEFEKLKATLYWAAGVRNLSALR